jgi:heme exporter protein CcmD
MMAAIKQFFNMGGYGFYVWLAYGSVFAYLFIQWLIPWHRWLKFNREQQHIENK